MDKCLAFVLYILCCICIGVASKKSSEGLSIIGYEESNVVSSNESYITYKYKDGDQLNLLCYCEKKQPFLFYVTWSYNGSEILRSPKTDQKISLNYNVTLDEKADNNILECKVSEVISEDYHRGYESSRFIKLLYTPQRKIEPIISTEVPGINNKSLLVNVTKDDNENKKKDGPKISNEIIYGIIGALIIIVIVMVVKMVRSLRKKYVKKNNAKLICNSAASTLETEYRGTVNRPVQTTVLKSQNRNMKTCDEYSVATDNKIDDETVNYSDLTYNYITPYQGTSTLYTDPVPKKFRTAPRTANVNKDYTNDKIDYENFQSNKKCNTISYANLKDRLDKIYANSNDGNNTLYCNA